MKDIRITWHRSCISLLLALTLVSTCSLVGLAASEQHQTKLAADLSVTGQVLVDGMETASGSTIFSGSTLETAAGGSATINLGQLGRLAYAAKSNSLLSFDEKGLTSALNAGAVTVSKAPGASAVISTKDGLIVAESASAAVFTVDVTAGNTLVTTRSGRVELRAGKESKSIGAGQSGTAGQGPNNNNGGNNNPSTTNGKAVAGMIGFTAIVVTAIIWALTRDNNGQGQRGNPIIISPLR